MMRFLPKVYALVARPRTKRVAAAPITAAAILTTGPNASITYIVEPYLADRGLSTSFLDAEQAPPRDIAAHGCQIIVIARYLPARWLPALKQFRSDGGQVIYCMDDDLMDSEATVGLPAAYAKRIRQQATSQRAALEALCTEFWVASPYLVQKYSSWKPRLVSPRPSVESIMKPRSTSVCYHGTASHQAELEWLVSVIADLQALDASTHFEVFGNQSINRMFRDIPRVAVLHPMSWTNYLAYSASVQRDVALAPLLPGLFNAARGPTKFFDFARMGAVGIYSDVPPYRGFIEDGVDGLLLSNDPAEWVSTIAQLLGDPLRRRRMADAARKRAEAMAWSPGNKVVSSFTT